MPFADLQDTYSAIWYLSVTPRHEGRGLPPGTESLHGRVRTLEDMTPDEIAALEALYGAPVQRRPVA